MSRVREAPVVDVDSCYLSEWGSHMTHLVETLGEVLVRFAADPLAGKEALREALDAFSRRHLDPHVDSYLRSIAGGVPEMVRKLDPDADGRVYASSTMLLLARMVMARVFWRHPSLTEPFYALCREIIELYPDADPTAREQFMLVLPIKVTKLHESGVFQLASGLRDRLLATDLEDLTPADLLLPFAHVSVRFHPCAGLTSDGVDIREVEVIAPIAMPDRVAFLVSGSTWVDSQNEAMFEYAGLLSKHSPIATSDAFDTVRVSERSALKNAMSLFWNAIAYLSYDSAEKSVLHPSPQAEKLHESLQDAPEGTKRRARLQALYDSACDGKKPTTLLGEHVIHIDPEAETAPPGSSDDERRRVQARFMVRGHYRKQACGPGRQDRKLIPIAPHWRGPENGVVRKTTYFVGPRKAPKP